MNRVIKVIALAICLTFTALPVFAVINQVNRLSGDDRYKTAFAIAEHHYSGFVKAVVLVPGSNFANAMPTSVLAFKLDAPVLLLDSSAQKTKEAFDYIVSHLTKIGTIYLVGDNGLVGPDFEAKLTQMGYQNIIRVSGLDKYDTDYLIAKQVNAAKGTPVVISSGELFPDVLSISSFAAANGWSVLLTEKDALNDRIKQYLRDQQPSTVYITGGTAVISSLVESEVESLVPNAVIKRFDGKDRYDTSIQVAKEFAPGPTTVYVASGLNFPDALAGSVLAAKSYSPILLVNSLSTSVLPEEVKAYLNEIKLLKSDTKITFFGGDAVIPLDLERLVAQEGGYIYNDLQAMEDEVLTIVNEERIKKGLQILSKNDVLTKLARLKSEDMIDKNYFDHQSPTYGSPFDMMKSFGIKYNSAGENIASGQASAKQVMEDWMNSPGHKANILKEEFREIGIGLAKDRNGQLYWTQMFIRP